MRVIFPIATARAIPDEYLGMTSLTAIIFHGKKFVRVAYDGGRRAARSRALPSRSGAAGQTGAL